MNNFAQYITPEHAKELGDKRSLRELRWAARRAGKCHVCKTEDIWRFVGLGMCFSCTTGEADASYDYELIATLPRMVA